MPLVKTISSLLIGLVFYPTLFTQVAFGQGRVVINEFMSWSGCNTNSEFIELMNFGPGPMNIGCFIVTNGNYAVTIPPNTVIQPGQYYLLSGQSILEKNCGNQDSTVKANLNWNDCNNCLDKPISTSDGFLQNGGNANEKIVLLDPGLNVLDAVSRQLPVSSSISITTASLLGSCSSKSFNLANMNISYETINNSTGIDNSYARRVDGDCGWTKTTAISAKAPNKTGSTASATYNFSTLSASECQSEFGKISIEVSASDVNSLFPMTYTLAYDKDSNGKYDETDIYRHGVDSTAPSIDIDKLTYGRYRITVGSAMGCNLKTFDFFIFNCYGILLNVDLLHFKYNQKEGNHLLFEARLASNHQLKTLELEGRIGNDFIKLQNYPVMDHQELIRMRIEPGSFTQFRLKLLDKTGNFTYSQVLNVATESPVNIQFYPNPVVKYLNIKNQNPSVKFMQYRILNVDGNLIAKGQLTFANQATEAIQLHHLSSGLYIIQLIEHLSSRQLFYQFYKQ